MRCQLSWEWLDVEWSEGRELETPSLFGLILYEVVDPCVDDTDGDNAMLVSVGLRSCAGTWCRLRLDDEGLDDVVLGFGS